MSAAGGERPDEISRRSRQFELAGDDIGLRIRLLEAAWDDASQRWRDEAARRFDTDCLTPLRAELRSYLQARQRLLDLLGSAERDTG